LSLKRRFWVRFQFAGLELSPSSGCHPWTVYRL
jgi:hypothetical protein